MNVLQVYTNLDSTKLPVSIVIPDLLGVLLYLDRVRILFEKDDQMIAIPFPLGRGSHRWFDNKGLGTSLRSSTPVPCGPIHVNNELKRAPTEA